MKKIIYNILCLLQFDRLVDFVLSSRTQIRLLRYKRAGVAIKFIEQGGYDLMIAGDLEKFQIHSTSHLKSDTFIETSGGVRIGKYFHVGRGLTIFSSVHSYKDAKKIPYDETVKLQPVVIGDFVWCGINVTILPGVTIGQGVVIGAGSIVSKDIPDYAIVAGNPIKKIGERDRAVFDKLLQEEQFY